MMNEEILRKMNDDMKMRNFSKYSFYTYSHKGAEMIKYFNKPMEEVTTDEMRKFLIMLKEERHLANKTVNYYNSILYQAATEEAGYNNLIELEEKWSKRRVSLDNWINNWENIQPFFKYGPETRKIMYTTNGIERLNNCYKKLNRGRRVFPTQQALEKSLYL